jgi:hypothetical protein
VKTDRTILNSKPGTIIWDTEEATCLLIDAAFSGDRNMTKEKAEKILKYKSLNNRCTACVKHKNNRDTTNNRDKWKHQKIFQKIPEQHNWIARRQRITENRHIVHCAHTSKQTYCALRTYFKTDILCTAHILKKGLM